MIKGGLTVGVKLLSKPILIPSNIKKALIFVYGTYVLKQIDLIEDITKLTKYAFLHIKAPSVPEKVEEIINKRLPFLPVHFSRLEPTSLFGYLQQEATGTHVFLIGTRKEITGWETICVQVGFPLDAIHEFELESDIKQVFCVKCYSLQQHQIGEPIFCSKCHVQLDVSNHFSKQHNAYLGYIRI